MKALYGVIHLAALPGAPDNRLSLEAVESRALKDARAYARAGFDGLVLENFGDAPFWPDRVGPETVAAMARIVRAVRLDQPDLALGVNVLRNDGEAALAVAHAVEAEFIRVNVLSGVSHSDQGTLTGRAAAILRLRKALDSAVRIFADVDVKHAVMAAHAEPLHQAEDLVEPAGAHALVVSGRATGSPPSAELAEALVGRFPGLPVLVGSGLDATNAHRLLAHASGAIVGTAVKQGRVTRNPVDPVGAATLVEAVRALTPGART
ncbi:MAG: BtpA/SgcQ family protein [Candidatus Latescibacteria bacterium]|nr:BtpA/SgcQ family protein [Candidatus Latescibacterota bacterium]